MGGADWRDMSWPEYQTMLPHWNLAHDPKAPPPTADTKRLERFVEAHTLQ
jgi:hypothetical protein